MQKINIILAPDQHIYFTSDMHFGHRNVIRFCNRPFADEKEMAQGLIKNWNDKVKSNDFVFSLGDFSWFTGRHQVKKLVEQLALPICILEWESRQDPLWGNGAKAKLE